MKKFEWLIIVLLVLFGGIELGLFLWAIHDGSDPVELLQIFSPLLLVSVLGLYFKRYLDSQKRILEIGINSHLSKKIAEERIKFYKGYLQIIEAARMWVLKNGITSSRDAEQEYLDKCIDLARKRIDSHIWLSSDLDIPMLEDIEKEYFVFYRESGLARAYEHSQKELDDQRRRNALDKASKSIEKMFDEKEYKELLRRIRRLVGTDQILALQKGVLDKAEKEITSR